MINILVGLGLPWLITTSAGLEVAMPDATSTSRLTTMSYLMFGCSAAYLAILIPSMHTWGRVGHASLGRVGGGFLFVTYAVAVGLFFLITDF